MTEPKVVYWSTGWMIPLPVRPKDLSGFVTHADYDALQARVEELENRYTGAHQVNLEVVAENKRLREAAARSIRKCEQYWNEHNIPDAEMHAALELIHSALYAALKEKS